MPVIAAAIIAGGVGIASSAMSSSSARQAQRDANRQNVALTKEQRDWEESMSNTAHQREVADLRAAGLNPVLSGTGGGGSSFHSVAPAQVQAEPAVSFGDVSGHVGTAMQASKQMALLENAVEKSKWDAVGAEADAKAKTLDADQKQGERAWRTSDPDHPSDAQYPDRPYGKREEVLYESQYGAASVELAKKRQELKNLIQQHEIGSSAAHRNRLIDEVMDMGEERVRSLLKWFKSSDGTKPIRELFGE